MAVDDQDLDTGPVLAQSACQLMGQGAVPCVRRPLDQRDVTLMMMLGETLAEQLEPLARFPTLNLAPDVLFEQAYEAGLVAELELAAVRAALAQRRHLPAALHLSVNVGPTGIMAAGFAAAVRSGGPLENLVLESMSCACGRTSSKSTAATVAPLGHDGRWSVQRTGTWTLTGHPAPVARSVRPPATQAQP